jgi:acyl-CoA synthetase (AMP-forming)/AMP-acid ligase II
VQEAAVVAIDSAGLEGKALCCAYSRLPNSKLTPPALKLHLARALPRYMIPTQWMALESMPRTSNGKTDRRVIKEYFQQQSISPNSSNAPIPERAEVQ